MIELDSDSQSLDAHDLAAGEDIGRSTVNLVAVLGHPHVHTIREVKQKWENAILTIVDYGLDGDRSAGEREARRVRTGEMATPKRYWYRTDSRLRFNVYIEGLSMGFVTRLRSSQQTSEKPGLNWEHIFAARSSIAGWMQTAVNEALPISSKLTQDFPDVRHRRALELNLLSNIPQCFGF